MCECPVQWQVHSHCHAPITLSQNFLIFPRSVFTPRWLTISHLPSASGNHILLCVSVKWLLLVSHGNGITQYLPQAGFISHNTMPSRGTLLFLKNEIQLQSRAYGLQMQVNRFVVKQTCIKPLSKSTTGPSSTPENPSKPRLTTACPFFHWDSDNQDRAFVSGVSG